LDDVRSCLLEMADLLSKGIVDQFPGKF